MQENSMTLLGISGSLREKSANSRLLAALTELLPPNVTYTAYEGLAELPHFNPDLDGDDSWEHAEVQRWRALLKQADAVVICTPEYARGLPGSLKNALDWMVSSGEFVNKPTAAISASPHPEGGAVTLESLVGTLKMMSAEVTDELRLSVPMVTKKFAADGRLADEKTKAELRRLAEALLRPVR
ncbi:flavoprotein [Saccharibacillus sp. O16]|nr:flavoprotein [Saccharibacillus sp. O16]